MCDFFLTAERLQAAPQKELMLYGSYLKYVEEYKVSSLNTSAVCGIYSSITVAFGVTFLDISNVTG